MKVEVRYDKNAPQWLLWGNPENIHWDPDRYVWINNNPSTELWRLGDKELTQPEEVPVNKRYHIVIRDDLWKHEESYASMMLVGMLRERRGRFVLVNVEENDESDDQYRIWPHLGILTVGTIADQEGYEVVLWDELNQGHVDLESVMRPGDIVGLSMVVSGMNRGIELARKAKELGARLVIAGNDGVIFRAPQVLSIPDRPIDAVFTSNSTNAIRQFFRQVGDTSNIDELQVQDVATRADLAPVRSNESSVMTADLKERKRARLAGSFDPMDGFVVPKLDLFTDTYWEQLWGLYRSQFGHKHTDRSGVRNALVHLAQGCTRTRGQDACTYCTIYGVGDLRLPSQDHLEATMATYDALGINTYFNVTDSALEMRALAKRIAQTGAKPETMVIYGRAQGMAQHPEFIDAWMATASDRLLINCGMDSGDPRMLHKGIVKSSLIRGSMVDENRLAVTNVKAAGAHLHFSLIFGSPGETVESCERSLQFLRWAAETLGPQLDVAETDIYWLNFGSAAARVFHDYAYARTLAQMAGKDISRRAWQKAFARHANELMVPWESQVAWYTYFTQIDIDTAQDFNRRAFAYMDQHPERVRARYYAFNDPNV